MEYRLKRSELADHIFSELKEGRNVYTVEADHCFAWIVVKGGFSVTGPKYIPKPDSDVTLISYEIESYIIAKYVSDTERLITKSEAIMWGLE